ncbi:MAG: type II/IV secretion system ATPase subunit [Nanoarchaeota archaeon]|nr:type II/IV secretion system ATPase subunit [Nanoarchaeota archaeon]MBU1134918.1 type II/IV secretion system ATPase subunit [Nanoarchaeota archaeon]MBU2520261.1 type II/IV secretion system ATPase subunit [Nanoarchaeota archaeon]
MATKSAPTYEYNEDKMQLKINYIGSIYGASLEDFEECMATAVDKLIEIKKINSIVLVKDREYEYGPEQTSMLMQIAITLNEITKGPLLSHEIFINDKYTHYSSELNSRLQYVVFNLLRRDPIGAYVEIRRDVRDIKIKIREAKNRNEHRCYFLYKRDILEPIMKMLEKTKIIRMVADKLAGYHLGDRSLYRDIFSSSIKPNFMLTRYMLTVPEGARSLDRYNVGDMQVEIFKMPDSTDCIYHVIPPEFALSETKYSILDAARRYMTVHRPKTIEFVKSTKVREMFQNIGRDVIRETSRRMGIELKPKELEQLTNILARYTTGLGVLEVLLADKNIQDLYINSPIDRQPILIFHETWEECKTNLIPTNEDAEAWATRLRIQSGRPLDEANPVLDTNIDVPGGSARFAVITRTLSPYGLGFAIRRHRDKPWTLPLFVKNKMMTPLAAGLMSFLVDGSVSILVAGGRSSGKTSMLGSLMLEILPKTRILTIEDTLELPVDQLMELEYNIERLKSRSVITRVETEMPADEALRTALRLGDSALIIGEVRSTEAKALYEAMRIGALSNVVAGTIHGESAYGVYDRVVNDLGVPKTSFKATDIIPICKMLRSADGLHRFRRMTEITEVRKEWEEDPLKEGGFVNLMQYSGKEDKLKPTDTLVNGESEILNRISSYVKEWSGNWDAVWENIKLRGRIKEAIVTMSDKLNKPEIMEADWMVRSNSMFHTLQESVRKEVGFSEPEKVYDEWLKWFKASIKKIN